MTTYIDAPSFIITPEILRLVAAIDEFKGGWPALANLPSERLREIEKHAITKGVAAGIRLSGGVLSDQQAAALLAGDLSLAQVGLTDNVSGHAKVLRLLTASSASIPFTEYHIKQLHRVLATAGAGERRGEYRDGNGDEIGKQMRQLIAWAEDAINQGQLHPLLVVAIFVLRFLFIHPFAEDNQRLSRLMALLLLVKNGYGFIRYYALPAVIEEQKDVYDHGLMKGLDRLGSDNTIAEVWLLAFFKVLLGQTEHARLVVSGARQATSRHSLEQKIIDHLRREGQTTNKLIQDATGANRNTIKVRLRQLVEQGELVKHGTGKGTRYTLCDAT